MEKSVVSIVKGKDPEAMVEQALDHLGGVRSFIEPRSTVVVKPNAGHEGAPDSSVNTSPGVVAAVINAVKKADPAKIILAEASAIGCDTMKCLEVSGIRKAANCTSWPSRLPWNTTKSKRNSTYSDTLVAQAAMNAVTMCGA